MTLIQPVYYGSMFSRDKVYGYSDDVDRSVFDQHLLLEWFDFSIRLMKSDLPTFLVLRWITSQNLGSSLMFYTFTTGKLQ